jgi:hypothetical protein
MDGFGEEVSVIVVAFGGKRTSQGIWPHRNRALGTERRAKLQWSIPARKTLRRRGLGIELVEVVYCLVPL